MAYESKLALLALVGFIIGLAVFAGTLIYAWKNRFDAVTRRAARTATLFAAVAGLLGLLWWTLAGSEPVFPFALVAVPLFFMAPVFVIVFYSRLVWLQRTAAAEDRG